MISMAHRLILDLNTHVMALWLITLLIAWDCKRTMCCICFKFYLVYYFVYFFTFLHLMRIKTLYNCVFTVSQTSVLPSTVWVQSSTHISIRLHQVCHRRSRRRRHCHKNNSLMNVNSKARSPLNCSLSPVKTAKKNCKNTINSTTLHDIIDSHTIRSTQNQNPFWAIARNDEQKGEQTAF